MLASIEGDFGYHDVIAIDPVAFEQVASWGAGQQLESVRGLLTILTEAGANPPADIPAGTVPVIAVNDPTVRVGQLVVLSAQGWQTPARRGTARVSICVDARAVRRRRGVAMPIPTVEA